MRLEWDSNPGKKSAAISADRCCDVEKRYQQLQTGKGCQDNCDIIGVQTSFIKRSKEKKKTEKKEKEII